MDFKQSEEILNLLYKDIDGHVLSREGRSNQNLTDKSFVYGEIKFDTFYQIISALQPQPGDVFYDLGSGTGKPVIAAYLLFPFAKVIGIELIEALYNTSAEVLKRFETEFIPTLKDNDGRREIAMIKGSFLDYDLTDANIIFMNSTCFTEELMLILAQKFKTLKPGTQIISLSKAFRDPSIEIIHSQLMEFSWGNATVYHQRKRKISIFSK